MVYQTGRNISASYKAETTFGQLPGATGGKLFRPNSGAMNLSKEGIMSNENRRDGMKTRGRHGSRSVAGSLSADLSLGSYDDFIAAAFRNSFSAALSITGLSMLADAAAKTFTRSAGSWITDGFRVGDVVRFGGFTTTANNAKNFRVTALTATVMTVAETPVAVTTAQTAVTCARPKKLLQGVTAPSFTIEENDLDIVGSEVFTGVRVGQMQLNLAPNGMATVDFSLVGQDMQIMQAGSSPYFTSPASTTSLGMTAAEAVIRLGNGDVVDLTALQLSLNLNAAGQPVVGSLVTPDVFTNLAQVDGSITALRSDLSRVQSFLNEDQLALHVMFVEPETEPKDFSSFFIGNLSLSSATKSELGADGPRTQTLSLMVGVDDRGGAYDPTMIKYQTSAA